MVAAVHGGRPLAMATRGANQRKGNRMSNPPAPLIVVTLRQVADYIEQHGINLGGDAYSDGGVTLEQAVSAVQPRPCDWWESHVTSRLAEVAEYGDTTESLVAKVREMADTIPRNG
jgi:hypothetical protein